MFFCILVPGSLRALLFPSTWQGTRNLWLTGQIQLEALMYVMLWVSGLPKTFGNAQPSAKSELLTRVWEFVAAPFPTIPLVKKKVWGLHLHSLCCYPRIARMPRTWTYPHKAITQAFWLQCILWVYLRGFLSWQALVFLRLMVELM